MLVPAFDEQRKDSELRRLTGIGARTDVPPNRGHDDVAFTPTPTVSGSRSREVAGSVRERAPCAAALLGGASLAPNAHLPLPLGEAARFAGWVVKCD